MLIIRRSSLVPVPWKNGGGITHELIRAPAIGDPFRWRVSIAQIDASGPFSNFTGYSRKMVLLRGAGMRLRFAAGPDRHLHTVGDMTEFDGALATECELLDGPCTDLNLMVCRSVPGVRAWVERVGQPRLLRPRFQGVILAFAISGSASVAVERCESARLNAWDLAAIAPHERGTIGPVTFDAAPPAFDATEAGMSAAEAEMRAARAGRGAPSPPLVFFAALDDNSAGEPL